MKYVADDGKVFHSEHLCRKYEEQLNASKKAEEEARLQISKLLDTCKENVSALNKAIEDFEKKYPDSDIALDVLPFSAIEEKDEDIEDIFRNAFFFGF